MIRTPLQFNERINFRNLSLSVGRVEASAWTLEIALFSPIIRELQLLIRNKIEQ